MIIFAKIIRLLDSPVVKELQRIAQNIEKIAAQRDEAVASLEKANEEIKDLKREVSCLNEMLHQKSLDIEFLTLSRKLASSPEALAEARVTVKRMLGKVDKALALLRNDAEI